MRSITICNPRPTLLRRSNHVKRIVVVVVVVVVTVVVVSHAKKHTDIKSTLLQGEHQTE
jgi:hypothetical protein